MECLIFQLTDLENIFKVLKKFFRQIEQLIITSKFVLITVNNNRNE